MLGVGFFPLYYRDCVDIIFMIYFIIAKLVFVSVVFGGLLMLVSFVRSKRKSSDGGKSTFWALIDFIAFIFAIVLLVLLIVLLFNFIFF